MSCNLFFKVWLLVPVLRNIAIVIVLTIAIWGIVWIHDNWCFTISGEYQFGVEHLVTALLVAALGLFLPFTGFFQPVALLRKWLVMLGASIFGCLAAHAHLFIFDPLFKRRGALGRLRKLPSK